MEKLIIVGAGGYAKSVLDSIDIYNYNMVGFLDEYSDKDTHLGYPVIAHHLTDIENKEQFVFFIAVGDNHNRKVWFNRLNSEKLRIINVIDQSAIISPRAIIGNGCFVGKQTIVNSGAKIGDNCILNTRSLIEHGCELKNHVNISPNAVVNGDVIVDDGVFIGSSSVSAGQLTIGKWSIVGAGAVVIRNVEPHVTVAGVPAKIIKQQVNIEEN